jgi:opacity protein-like surface antigen
VVATGKLLSTVYERLHPYVSGELGAAFNAASSYHETPLIDEAVTIAPFSNRTQSSFAWGAGVGVDVDVNTNLRLGLGYQFVDLGKATLGLSPAQETHEHLGISNLYDHQLRFQLTALI